VLNFCVSHSQDGYFDKETEKFFKSENNAELFKVAEKAKDSARVQRQREMEKMHSDIKDAEDMIMSARRGAADDEEEEDHEDLPSSIPRPQFTHFPTRPTTPQITFLDTKDEIDIDATIDSYVVVEEEEEEEQFDASADVDDYNAVATINVKF
jgi:hypothetical protein